MKVLLHIGSQKTGSTSLQATFKKFRHRLASKGVLYPVLPPLASHSILAVPFFKTGIPREFYQTMGRNKADVDAVAMAYWQDVVRQAQEQPGIDTIVISGEHFLDIEDHQGMAHHLARLFPGCEVSVLCYLRDPISYYVSYLKQRIKASHNLFWPRTENWAPKLTAWQSLGPVTVREFAPSLLRDGDLVCDALAWVSEALAEQFTLETVRANQSISSEAALILFNYRRLIHTERNDLFLPDSQRLFTALKRAEARLPEPRRAAVLKPGMKERLLFEAGPDLKALRKTFGFVFKGDGLYDLETAQTVVKEMAPLDSAPKFLGEILAIHRPYLERLQAETFAQLLQGFSTRENQK